MPGTMCAVATCNNSLKITKGLNKGISYHCFPKDSEPERLKAWVLQTKRADKFNPKTSHICSEHFKSEDFERNLKAELLNLKVKRQLKKSAIPFLKRLNNTSTIRFENRKKKLQNGDYEHNDYNIVDTNQEYCTMEYFVNKRSKRYGKCCLTNCKSHDMNKDKLSFFCFPKDPARCAVWIENCNFDQLKPIENYSTNNSIRLCSLHFETQMFSNFQKNRLKSEATPTLFDEPANIYLNESYSSDFIRSLSSTPDEMRLESVKEKFDPEFEDLKSSVSCSRPTTKKETYKIYYETEINPLIDHNYAKPRDPYVSYNDLQKNSSDVSCQTPHCFTNNSPRKLKLENAVQAKNEDIQYLENKLKALTEQLTQVNTQKHMLVLCKQFLPSSLYLMVESDISHRNKKDFGHRYSDELKELARTIHKLSPRVYTFLKSVFPLPSLGHLYINHSSN